MNKTALFYLTALLATAPALASGIPALFPFAAQSHDQKGEVEMGWSTSINGTNNGVLNFKKKDDLKGKCDGITCTISGKITPAYSLPRFNHSPFTLPGFKKTNSSFEAKCSGSGTIKYDRDAYEKVEAQGNCRLHIANTGDVLIKGDLSAQGSTILYLDSGNYWLDSLKLSGDTKLVINGSGDVNFYIKDNVDVSISNQIGSPSQKVNIFHYDNDEVKLGDNAKWYGDIKSYGDVKLKGSSKLYGAVQAKSLELSGSTRLYLDAGTYWYEEVDLQGSARVIPQGDELTTFYIEEDLELQGSTELGTSENPVLAFVYGDGDDDGEAELEGSSKIYGYVYVEGELEMQGSTKIFGAVNVVDLEMEGSASINYSAIPVSGEVHHYKLSFDVEANHLTAYACGDEACSEALLYSRSATLHIKDGLNNNSISNFNKFLKSDKDTNPNTKLEKNKCIQFVDKKADPKPESSPGLRCYLSDGTQLPNCKLCAEQDVQSSLAAYVYDEITLNEEKLGETIPNFNFYITDINGTGTLQTGNRVLKKGSEVSFPLDLTYNKAEAISLTIKGDNGKNGKNRQEVEYQLELVFVPKQLRWSAADCSGDSGFLYAEHAASCTVLGNAGEQVGLTLQAYGENDKLIDDYSAQLQGIVIHELTAELEQTREFEQGIFEFNQKSKASFETTSKIASVALIQATVPETCAPYAVSDNGCMLYTDGDIAIVGRTVPDRLLITGIPGKLKNGFAYRGKETEFSEFPYFTIRGCAVGQSDEKCSLKSYRGEFAKGLFIDAVGFKNNSEYLLSLENLNDYISLGGDGVHTVDVPPLTFKKRDLDKSKKLAQLFQDADDDLNLVLNAKVMSDAVINADGTYSPPMGSRQAKIAETGEVRFGFITLMDAEIPVNKEGIMFTKLHYYGESLKQLKEDISTDYDLSDGSHVQAALDGNSVKNLTFGFKPKAGSEVSEDIKVDPYASELKDIIVTIEGLHDWLKPADKDNEGDLADPEALLDITGRFSPGERTFNRREATR
ncbi:DUF6701 domain-containing protein [Oceanimonas sp. CAM02]|uniref:DUF7305 domain-containing protein n=1 Tax=Oceanimonas sp. CAM02 TaxID=3080336 RepID=UPI0029360B2E|nr:DUF6701 domain-containing protein [Oceanimonas sp. CAM02]MDV2858633.1 hypothetical protein [Oceanimonas sp. CAM02]